MARNNLELIAMLEQACALMQEAKGLADGEGGGDVTDHLDFAESWVGKVIDALSAA